MGKKNERAKEGKGEAMHKSRPSLPNEGPLGTISECGMRGEARHNVGRDEQRTQAGQGDSYGKGALPRACKENEGKDAAQK
jgi:hypothetical protein